MERPDLTPAIVQDAESNRVLMLAWMDEEALRRTRESGEAWFWSRSREAYWRKGETSGNTLAVEELREDCDGDTILLRVRPAGPVCHTGAESCFAPWLWRVITERGLQRPEGSYVVTLLDDPSLAARKVGEEGLEAALAGAGESDQRLVEELADLWFHSYALLAARGLDPRLVEEELGRRRGTAASAPAAGLAPPAARSARSNAGPGSVPAEQQERRGLLGLVGSRPPQPFEERLAVGLDAAGEDGVGPAELEQVERLTESVQPRCLAAEGHVRAGEPEEDPEVPGVRVDDDVREARRVDEPRPVREGDAVELDERLDAREPRPEDDGAALRRGRKRLRMTERGGRSDAGEPARARERTQAAQLQVLGDVEVAVGRDPARSEHDRHLSRPPAGRATRWRRRRHRRC